MAKGGVVSVLMAVVITFSLQCPQTSNLSFLAMRIVNPSVYMTSLLVYGRIMDYSS